MAGRRVINREEIKRLHGEGLTDREISERLGCSYEHLRKLREAAGLEPNPEPFDEGKMMALYRAHWSIHKIADEMGVEDEEIERRLRDVTRQH